MIGNKNRDHKQGIFIFRSSKRMVSFLFLIPFVVFLLGADSTTSATGDTTEIEMPKKEEKIETKKIEKIDKKIEKKEPMKEEYDSSTSASEVVSETRNEPIKEKIVKEEKKPEVKETTKEKPSYDSVTESSVLESSKKEVITEKKEIKKEDKIVKEVKKEPSYDSTTQASEMVIEKKEVKKVEKVKKIEEKMPVEIPVKEERLVFEEERSVPVEIIEEEEGYLSGDENSKKESSMIIFDEIYDSSLPVMDEFENIYVSEQIPWYGSEDFIPKNINEFFRAEPDYYSNNDKVITAGRNRINDKLGEEVFAKAYELFRTNNLKNARTLFEKLVNYNYRVAECYYYTSWCYFLKRNYIFSLNYMKEALREGELSGLSQSLLSDYLYQIGNIYIKLDDFNEAIPFFLGSIKMNDSIYKSYNKLGFSYYKIEDTNNALKAWKKGAEYGDPVSAKNYEWLSKSLSSEK